MFKKKLGSIPPNWRCQWEMIGLVVGIPEPSPCDDWGPGGKIQVISSPQP